MNAGDAAKRVPVSVKFGYNGHGELTERTGRARRDVLRLRQGGPAQVRGGTATWEYDPANGRGLLKRRSYDRDTVRTSASSCPFGDDFAGDVHVQHGRAARTGPTTSRRASGLPGPHPPHRRVRAVHATSPRMLASSGRAIGVHAGWSLASSRSPVSPSSARLTIRPSLVRNTNIRP